MAPLSSQHLEAVCRVLADTGRGLSGTQIERLLQEKKMGSGNVLRLRKAGEDQAASLKK